MRKIEELRNLQQKEMTVVGCIYFDAMNERLEHIKSSKKPASGDVTVLLAPSWGPNAILTKYGNVFLKALKETGFNIIVRPHPQSRTSEKKMLDEFEKDRIPMYVLSNSGFTAKALWTVLDRFGIGQYFSNVWSSADYGKIKPCKEFFDMAIDAVLLEHPQERKEDILFIGDTYNTDVIGAHNAGIKAVWINRKKEEDTLKYATYQIAETNGLIDIVNSIRGTVL